jgi:hypothetical protein
MSNSIKWGTHRDKMSEPSKIDMRKLKYSNNNLGARIFLNPQQANMDNKYHSQNEKQQT